jgi:hypothetical protein
MLRVRPGSASRHSGSALDNTVLGDIEGCCPQLLTSLKEPRYAFFENNNAIPDSSSVGFMIQQLQRFVDGFMR